MAGFMMLSGSRSILRSWIRWIKRMKNPRYLATVATTSIVVKDVAAVVCVRKWEPISHSAPRTRTSSAGGKQHDACRKRCAREEDELRYEVLVILQLKYFGHLQEFKPFLKWGVMTT